MIEENVFVPKILLCGSREEFFSQVGQRPFKIVGQVEFFGMMAEHQINFLQDGKFLLNDKLVEYPEIPNMIREGSFDFIVFNDSTVYSKIYICFPTKPISSKIFSHLL